MCTNCTDGILRGLGHPKIQKSERRIKQVPKVGGAWQKEHWYHNKTGLIQGVWLLPSCINLRKSTSICLLRRTTARIRVSMCAKCQASCSAHSDSFMYVSEQKAPWQCTEIKKQRHRRQRQEKALRNTLLGWHTATQSM